MRYRISSIRHKISLERRGCFRAIKRVHKPSLPKILPPDVKRQYTEHIRLDTLFEVSMLPEAKRKRARRPSFDPSPFFSTLKNAVLVLRESIARRKINALPLRFWAGAVCSAIIVTSLSATAVVLSLFWGTLARKTEITVPQFVGIGYESLTIPPRSELILSYEASNDVPAGVVINQTPRSGAKRKLRDKESLYIYLTVSAGKSFHTVLDLVGLNERDALLQLQNLEIATSVSYEYSSSVPQGKIISTSPKKDERLYDGQRLVLKVSLGERTHTASMPNLYGLSEAQCAEALRMRGLKLGSVTYKNSPIAQGKAIEQQYPPYSQIDSRSTVDIVISLGEKQTPKSVPDLYGLTLEQAKLSLAGVGLVLGNVFSVSSGAPQGTVIAQTPIGSTQITPFITSVDVFISS